MKKQLKTITFIILGLLGFTIATTPVFAAPASDTTTSNDSSSETSKTVDACSQSIPEAVSNAAGCNTNTDALPSAIISILSAIIIITGLVSATYIIIGGIQYISSSGDANKTEKAKKTVLYACIGLIICALAFVIVNFVISNILGQSAPTPSSEEEAESFLQLPIAFLKEQL